MKVLAVGDLLRQELLDGGEHGVLVLFALPAQAHVGGAEDLLHGLEGGGGVALVGERLNVGNGLPGVNFEMAQALEPPLGVLHELLLKAVAVQALEHQLAQLQQNDLSHKRNSFRGGSRFSAPLVIQQPYFNTLFPRTQGTNALSGVDMGVKFAIY